MSLTTNNKSNSTINKEYSIVKSFCQFQKNLIINRFKEVNNLLPILEENCGEGVSYGPRLKEDLYQLTEIRGYNLTDYKDKIMFPSLKFLCEESESYLLVERPDGCIDIFKMYVILSFCRSYLVEKLGKDSTRPEKMSVPDALINCLFIKIICQELQIELYKETVATLSRHYTAIQPLVDEYINNDELVDYRTVLSATYGRDEAVIYSIPKMTLFPDMSIKMPATACEHFLRTATEFPGCLKYSYRTLEFPRKLFDFSSRLYESYFPVQDSKDFYTGSMRTELISNTYHYFDNRGAINLRSPFCKTEVESITEFIEIFEMGLFVFTKNLEPVLVHVRNNTSYGLTIHRRGEKSASSHSGLLGYKYDDKYKPSKDSRIYRLYTNLLKIYKPYPDVWVYTYHLVDGITAATFMKDMTRKYSDVKSTLKAILDY